MILLFEDVPNTKLFCLKDIWAGSYNTVARADEDQIMVMGLNNYAQLALPTTKALTFFMPQLSKEMTKLAWNCVAIGQHHVIAVEQSGQVSPELPQEINSPTQPINLSLVRFTPWGGRSMAASVSERTEMTPQYQH